MFPLCLSAFLTLLGNSWHSHSLSLLPPPSILLSSCAYFPRPFLSLSVSLSQYYPLMVWLFWRRGSCADRWPALDGIFAANSYNVSAFEENGSTELESYVKSTFTYNKGGVWHGVMPPDELYCSNSDPFCTLNLYMLADQATITPMLADKNAVGLILAQGNEGYYRQDADEALFLYLSRNGGVTWDRLMEGSFQFTMASHGSLFLAAENDRANNTLFYSWNQGAAFDGCIFADENVFVEVRACTLTSLSLSDASLPGVRAICRPLPLSFLTLALPFFAKSYALSLLCSLLTHTHSLRMSVSKYAHCRARACV